MQRKERQRKILEIIRNKEIETQNELCDALNSEGYDVTQATISRDIHELRLNKIAGKEKRFRYTYTQEVQSNISDHFKMLFRASVLEIKRAQNLIVIKTIAGNGNNAGALVDNLAYPEIVGCVSGDDTVLVVCEDGLAAKTVEDKLNAIRG